MECSRDSGNCWEKDLSRGQATGCSGGAWLLAQRVPGPAGSRRGRPRCPPGPAASRAAELGPTPALPGCRSTPAVPARPAGHEESAGTGSSRAGASPPPRDCAPAGAMRNGSGPSGIPENLNPGLSHPCLRLTLQVCLFPRGGAAPSQREAAWSCIPLGEGGRRLKKTRAEPERCRHSPGDDNSYFVEL